MVLTIAAVVALLTAPALLLTLMARDRRQLRRTPGVFRCEVRLLHGTRRGLGPQGRARSAWAAWAHDVLLVRPSRWSATTQALPVRSPDGSVARVSPRDVRGLGSAPVALRLLLDDGDVVEVAAPGEVRELLAGPFVVACVTSATPGG